ncbi:hypothetical protein N0V90_007297 [Kalmusia sp. IMI 367209]|nr:hypothetical protein N0V90_007297 [Kalmusia sp. IMI 367209]
MEKFEASSHPVVDESVSGKSLNNIKTSKAPYIQIERLHTASSSTSNANAPRTIYHIYPIKDKLHKLITTAIDIKKETGRQARRKKKEQKQNATEAAQADNLKFTKVNAANPTAIGDSPKDDTFFLHAPYLAFHRPPQVLCTGPNKKSDPVVLIHPTSFWRRYKLQYSTALLTNHVLDPRGVVTWSHDSDKSSRKLTPTLLKGYKVRTWRLWGESGKAYVHQIRAARRAGKGYDPDFPDINADEKPVRPAEADGVVWLEWEAPFSRNTRRYAWMYSGVQFYWKGTKNVKKTTFCGRFVRFNHLKLVALPPSGDRSKMTEVCLARYASSVSNKKNGRLEVFDDTVLRLFEDRIRSKNRVHPAEPKDTRLKALKKTVLYALILATAMCMISSEKGKREAVGKILKDAAENGGEG